MTRHEAELLALGMNLHEPSRRLHRGVIFVLGFLTGVVVCAAAIIFSGG